MSNINIEALIQQTDILEYINQFLDLQKRGGEFWGNCPIHEEFTPSFSVNEENQTFYCFGCGKGGNIINFVMDYHKCNFPQALKTLQEFYNIKDEIEYIPPPEIVKILRQYKPKIKHKKEFVRKILPNNIMDKYDKRSILWTEEGISKEVLEKYQVRYDVDKDTIVFPIWDNDGNIIAIKARDTTGIAPSKYCYYNKIGTIDFLYGYWQHKDIIKQCKEAILVEGEKSLMKFETWGIKNVLSLCNGCLTDDQLHAIIDLGVNVVVALDKDKNATKDEDIQKLKRFCRVEYIWDRNNLTEVKDSPCDRGIDVWNKLYSERKRLK